MLGHSEYPLNVYGSGLTPAYIPFISLAGARHLSDPNQRLTGLAGPEYDARSLSEKQCSKRYASLVECKDANYSTTKSRLL